MKRLLLPIIMLFIYPVHAQDTIITKEFICGNPETHPEFPGGNIAIYKYLAETIKYPEEAIEKCITGTVYVKFIVTEDGYVTSVKIAKGLGYGCDEEAIRAVTSMPIWKPGTQNNKAIKVTYYLPVKFEIDD